MGTLTEVLLARLVAHATESRTPNRGLIDEVAERCEALGARVSLVAGDGSDGHGPAHQRVNLLATFGPDQPGGLLLSGHSDVVPAGQGWSSDPYVLTDVGDGRLAARGSADMKGFIASALVAIEARASTRSGGGFARPVHLALSFDEEIGCVGVRGLLHHLARHHHLQPDLVLIGEPSMMRPRHRHLGKLGYDVTVRSEPAHSSLSYRVSNAISAAARVIGELDAIGDRAAGRAAALGADAEPDVTVNVGVIDGGTGLNVVAERCRFTFELRNSFERDPDAELTPVWSRIDDERQLLAAVGGIDVAETVRYPALATDVDHDLVRLVERIADAGPCTPIGFGTEGGLFAAALGTPVVICGPGDIAVAHRPDEYVTRSQLARCDTFLTTLLAAFGD